ncbi:MAG TPA: energy transducer TonB, partial [Bryobacteraceae bacterium]|nr:energy transducer TonB [Bryobacteraceae bacterium]
FRFMKTPPPTPAPAPNPVEAKPAATRARAIHRVPPVVPASIRPRIRGKIPIDVRVHINARGRVTSASPVTRPHGGLESYLAGRAVYAAKLWRFEPVRENGKPVPGTEVIHFEFER